MDKTLEQEIRQILTETCRGEIHAATASILTLIAAARPAVVSDEVVEAMCRAHDGEESAQMGEPSLWAIRDRGDWTETCEGDGGWENYHSSRLAAMRAALALLPGGVPDGGWPKTNKPMMPVEEFLASQPGGVVPDREAIARVIGSYVVYDDKGGPDTEVLQDVIGGDHDESVRRVYELTDAIIAMLSAPAVPDGYVLVPREPTEAMVNAVWHHWLHGMGHSQECMRDALRAMLSASPMGTDVAESAAGDASHLTASETPCKSEWPNPACPCTDPLWCIQRELCKRTTQEPPSPTPCDLWRDISTAPKDGKPILLGWLELGWVGEGRFIEDAGWFEAGAHPTDHTDGEVWPDLWMSMPELPLRVAGPCVLHPHSDEKDAGENDQSREEQNPSASPKGSSQSQPSRTAQEPPSPTPCDLEGK